MNLFRITLASIVVFSFFSSGSVHADGYERLRKMNEISREMAKERNQEIVFFGKVVDFKDNPIPDAKVTMRIRVFGVRSPQSNFKVVETQTDEDGNYSISNFGEMITLESIIKEGYEYSYKYNHKRYLDSKKTGKRNGIGYEPEKPMVFKVRKEGPPAFLMGDGGIINIRPGEVVLMDMYQRNWSRPERLFTHKMSYPDWHADLKMSVEKDASGYRLIFEALEPASGFVKASSRFKDELIEAPEYGYKPKLVVPIKEGEGGSFYAYVKNEGGLFYSRVTGRYSHRKNADYISYEYSYSTNMAGERGFEFSIDLYEEYLRIDDEMRLPRMSREQLRDGTIVLPVLKASQ